MLKIATITLMRKGSKRFPGKNVAKYKGKPLYMHTVETALKLKYPYYLFHDYGDEIEIPAGVNVVGRNEYFAGDMHRTNEEIKASRIDADIYILLQVTSPHRSIQDMKKWIKQFTGPQFPDVGFAVHILPDGYYYLNPGKAINFKRDDRTDNGCAKKKVWKETGSFYIFKKEQLDKDHILDSNNRMPFFDRYNIDIDFEKDLA